MNIKNLVRIVLLISFSFNLIACQKLSEGSSSNKPTEEEITEAYVYLLGRALAVRQEKTDLNESGVDYNLIKYNEVGKAEFVNPNLDVAYMESWFAIDQNSAILLEIPKIEDRYYTVQLMDGWGEVFENINERNFPNHPYGKFMLCLENTTINIPEGVQKIIVPSEKVKMLARVELQKTWDEAVSLQKQFKASVVGIPKIASIPKIGDFTNEKLIGVELFKNTDELLKTADITLSEKDPIQSTVKKVAEFVTQSEANATQVEQIIEEKSIPKFIEFATSNAGKLENNWLATLYAGEYKGDYWMRSAANFVGIWANTPAEVIYLIASKDSDDEVLAGGKKYILKFDQNNLPVKNVNSFWSIILVDFPNYRVVSNELNRYNLNNFSDFTYETDGALNIYIAPDYDPSWPKSNWLPSPKEGKFNLTMRMYVPKQNVIDGDWFPNSIAKMK